MCMLVFVFQSYVHMDAVAHKDQKRMLDPLCLWLQVAVNGSWEPN